MQACLAQLNKNQMTIGVAPARIACPNMLYILDETVSYLQVVLVSDKEVLEAKTSSPYIYLVIHMDTISHHTLV